MASTNIKIVTGPALGQHEAEETNMKSKRITRTLAIVAAAAIAPPLHAQGNLTELSAADAAKLIRAGKLKSEDLVKALADQIEKKMDLGASIAYDRAAAIKAARAADADAAKA